MAYQKHEWQDNEVITKDLLNNIENGIATIELTPGPAGPAGPAGERGPAGPQGPAGTTPGDATTEAKGIVKMATKVDEITVANAVAAKEAYTQADINGMVILINKNKEVINAILSALKTAGIMKNN